MPGTSRPASNTCLSPSGQGSGGPEHAPRLRGVGLEATGARLQPSHPAQGLGLHSSFSCYTYPVWEKLFLAGFFVLGRGGGGF